VAYEGRGDGEEASRTLGSSRAYGYGLIGSGQFPCRALRVGRTTRVATAALIRVPESREPKHNGPRARCRPVPWFRHAEAPPKCSWRTPGSHRAITPVPQTGQASSGPEDTESALHACNGLAWTPDTFYNLCHVVPRDGPKISTGRCSGPSKRYCSVSILASVTGSHLHLSRSVTRPLRDLPMPPPLEAGPPRPASRTTSSSSSRWCARPTWRAGDPAPRCWPGT
jgi:hypothetical protein